MPVVLKRASERPGKDDGARILVDRLWPPGIAKVKARVDFWLKELAPSDVLRCWFHGRPSMWRAFRKRYLEELRAPQAQPPLQQLYDMVRQRNTVTLVFGSRDPEHNHAVILKEIIDGARKPPSSSGAQRAVAAQRARARRPS
jgi:uncharacterized protein YeaO (DUF488 family)